MLNIIISECRDGGPAGRKLEQELSRRLSERPDCRVAVVPHLYDLAADGAAIRHLQAADGPLVVFSWLYPRAAYWVLSANKIHGRMGHTSLFSDEELEPASADSLAALPERTIWCIDLRSRSTPEPYVEEVAAILRASGEPAAAGPPLAPGRVEEETVYRWYPVIDYRRCTGCLECLNFCLFGVFDLGENQRPLVDQPDACRDGCPACARICPSQAIMFPEHGDSALAGNGSPRTAPVQPQSEDARRKAESDRKRAQSPDDLDRLVDEVDELDL
jgi:NAD-dependent dihydropyrimidine dehydrogenase PreA subunit